MSPVRINGSTSGYTEIDAPAVAGSNTLTLPTGNGTSGQVLVTNGSGALSWSDRGRMTLATAQNSTSGTSIDFTGIPSWVKRVTVMFNGVSTNGTSIVQIQIGSGSITSSGYTGYAYRAGVGGNNFASMSAGFVVSDSQPATATRYGTLVLSTMSSNIWIMAGSLTDSSASGGSCLINGAVTLSGTLDRVRITTVNGTDTFDAGSINILYEG